MKNKSPSLSAVMFIYNEEKYIAEMLFSIFNQNTTVSKVIIVDDYSTDNTLNIIKEFQKEHDNIEIIKSKQKGKVFAYITGLEKVATEYFFICAGDDYLLPEYVSELLRETQEKNLDFIYARYFITDSELKNPIGLKRKSIYSRAEIIRANRVSGYLFGKSKIIDKILPLPTAVSFEDWITSLKLADRYFEVNLSEKPLFYYRKHQTSTSEKLKNVGMRSRDINFIKYILSSSTIPLSENDKKTLKIRLQYYQQLTGNYSTLNILRLLFNRNLFAIDKIRLLFLLLPFIKNDNDTQKLLTKLTKFNSLK